MFPELKIDLVRSECLLYNGSTRNPGNNLILYNQQSNSGIIISLLLNYSAKSNLYYSYTNQNNFKSGYFKDLDFLYHMMIEYYLNNKRNISIDIKKEITQFVSDNILNIKEAFNQSFLVHTYPSGGSNQWTPVMSEFIVDIESVTVENISEYLIKIVEINYNNIKDYIELRLKPPSEDIIKGKPYIRALYSKKAYKIQAYLAHHLIRAGLSPEFKDFINQYFKIKEQLPKEYFWNLIFLTQFGFNYYYYYWLTNDRMLKFTTPKEFEEKAKEYTDTSTLTFFSKFHLNCNSALYRRMVEVYTKGDFRKFLVLTQGGIKVMVKPQYRERLKNLRIATYYNALTIEDNYCFISGDDFRVHKYLLKNFEIINS